MIALIVSLVGNIRFYLQKTNYRFISNKNILKQDSLLSVKLLMDKHLDEAQETIHFIQEKNESELLALEKAQKALRNSEKRIEEMQAEQLKVDQLKQELVELKRDNTKFETQLVQLKQDRMGLTYDLSKVNTEKESLYQANNLLIKKLAEASKLNAQSISVSLIKQHRKKTVQTLSAKQTDFVKVTCEIGDNPFAEAGKKTVYLILVGPENTVQGEESEKFLNQENGKEISYTMRSVINYSKSRQKLNFDYAPKHKLKKGRYKVEFYIDGTYGGQYGFAMK